MEAPVAIYRGSFGSFHWHYALFEDKLIASRRSMIDKKQVEVKLTECDATPDRGVTVLIDPIPVRYLGLTAIVLIVSLIVTGYLMMHVLRAGNHLIPAEVGVFIWLATLFAASIAVLIVLSRFLREELIQHYAVFKRLSDGRRLCLLSSTIDPENDAFEDFIAKAIQSITRLHSGIPPKDAFEPRAREALQVGRNEAGVPFAHYRGTDGGWRWSYTLVPYRLLLQGENRRENKHIVVALEHCDENPERATTWVHVFQWQRFLIGSALSIVFLSAMAVGQFKGFMTWAMLSAIVPVLGALMWHFRKRSPRVYATFKRKSDGTPMFSLIDMMPNDEFDEFVLDVSVAIRVSRGEDPDVSTAIRAKG